MRLLKNKLNLKDLTLKELEKLVVDQGFPLYRGRQIAGWVFGKGVTSFDEMSNLPLPLRESLARTACLSKPDLLVRQVSRRGDTIKYLFGLTDGQAIETVLMKHNYGLSVCVSTQAGCRMGCRLCASGLGGLVRNLSPGEIYDQVLFVQKDRGERVSHVVVMGTGEPLDNFEATITFIKNITAPYGLNIGARHITVSTCGLAPQIRKLADHKLPVTLAVSLHAPNDSLRNELVPVNRRYPLPELLAACLYYIEKTGRRVTYEYALIAGVNDSPGAAAELSRLLKNILCHVNLIPANPVPERGLEPTRPDQVECFKHKLTEMGINATVRRELGADIEAACGQLRRRFSKESGEAVKKPGLP
ncbi:MAG: 23S rRNA (adenine(2503)-C(2))-methyltransferase RlmN [Eubacteriales bacterium]